MKPGILHPLCAAPQPVGFLASPVRLLYFPLSTGFSLCRGLSFINLSSFICTDLEGLSGAGSSAKLWFSHQTRRAAILGVFPNGPSTPAVESVLSRFVKTHFRCFSVISDLTLLCFLLSSVRKLVTGSLQEKKTGPEMSQS